VNSKQGGQSPAIKSLDKRASLSQKSSPKGFGAEQQKPNEQTLTDEQLLRKMDLKAEK
jgi:hypothetical protein